MSVTYELTPCIACGGDETTTVADADAIRREIEELWSFHSRRLAPDTPARHLADRVAFSQPPAVRLVRCDRCGLVFRNPIERARNVLDLYTGETPHPDVLERLHRTQMDTMRAQAHRLTTFVGRAGNLIEVGSYVGGFLAASRDLGWTPVGVDVNPAVNAWVRARGARVIDGELPDVPATGVDAVTFWNCFDQLADPAAALVAARERLLESGVIVIRVPNGAAYTSLRVAPPPFRGVARSVLATNNLLAFPYRYGFTDAALGRLLERAGFRIARVLGDTLVPIADRWTRPWARAEERVLKGAVRWLARARAVPAPWIEVYARRR